MLEQTLAPHRVKRIAAGIAASDHAGPVRYVAPWSDPTALEPRSVDMIFSQAVLEHVDDLEAVYGAMSRWLRAGGFISHQIDFRSHGTASSWDAHWALPDWLWRLVRGRRAYLINRQPISTHRALLDGHGFRVVFEQPVELPRIVVDGRLAPRFRRIPASDLGTSGAFLQANRP